MNALSWSLNSKSRPISAPTSITNKLDVEKLPLADAEYNLTPVKPGVVPFGIVILSVF